MTSQQVYVDRDIFRDMIYDIFIYLLKLGFHSVAMVGKLLEK